jgi:ubiquinone/menaquinone biosynthesis C-methylase UbiE
MTAFEEERIRLREEVWSLLDIKQGAKFLDVGLGHTAHSLTKLVESGVAVTSIDIDFEILRLHRSNPANFVQGNAAQIPFKDDAFSLSLAYFTFHEIDPCLHMKAVTELCRVSKIIVIVEPAISEDPVYRIYQRIWTDAMHSIGKYEDIQPKDYWTELLYKGGAETVTAKNLSYHVRLRGQESAEYVRAATEDLRDENLSEAFINKMRSLAEDINPEGILFPDINVIMGTARR